MFRAGSRRSNGFCPNKATFSAACSISVAAVTGRTRSPGDTPSERKPKSARRNRAARLAEQTGFAPNTETFSAVHNLSVAAATGRTRSPGVLRGRSRIEFIVSPLPRRRHNESHFAAEPPERAFLAKPFFARAKNGVNSGRRSLKISVGKTKPDSEPSPLRGRWRRSRRMRCSATARYRA